MRCPAFVAVLLVLLSLVLAAQDFDLMDIARAPKAVVITAMAAILTIFAVAFLVWRRLNAHKDEIK